MKIGYVIKLSLVLFLTIISLEITAKGQGVITFNRNNWIGTSYIENGILFQLIIPKGSSFDDMGILIGSGNAPYSGTPFMEWFNQYNPDNYVAISLVSGGLFGLSSVDLADPLYPPYPSSPLCSITFVGTKWDNSTVSQTFYPPSGTRDFLTCHFDSDFAYGLKSVDILAPRWAMDNLVFIPEPSTTALIGFGLLAGWRMLQKRR